MKRYFLDTNIFLRTLIKEDEVAFRDCCRLLKAVKSNKIGAVTANLVLAEVVWTLSSYYRFPRAEVARAVKSIINLRGIRVVDGYDAKIALEAFADKNVKYIDCLIASIARVRGKEWVVVSYDKDFDELPVLRVEPKELVSSLD